MRKHASVQPPRMKRPPAAGGLSSFRGSESRRLKGASKRIRTSGPVIRNPFFGACPRCDPESGAARSSNKFPLGVPSVVPQLDSCFWRLVLPPQVWSGNVVVFSPPLRQYSNTGASSEGRCSGTLRGASDLRYTNSSIGTNDRAPLPARRSPIALFGPGSGTRLATVVRVLAEVPVMLSACKACNNTRYWFPAS